MGLLPSPVKPVVARVTYLTDWRQAHPAAGVAATVNTAAAVQQLPEPAGSAHVEMSIEADGPQIAWWGADPEELQVMAMALLDAARAARNGDDINAVAQQEWRRRGGRPELD